MNAARIPQSAPPPPDRILLELSAEEADVLYFIACRNEIIPAALTQGDYASDASRVEHFQDALRPVLYGVGARSKREEKARSLEGVDVIAAREGKR